MRNLFIDFETASEVDLAKVGAHRYAQHPSTRILLVSWRRDDGETHTEEEVSDELIRYILDPSIRKVAHNAEFEMCVCTYILRLPLRIQGWFDTMYQAAYYSYPQGLSRLSVALNTVRKASSEEMLMFSKPLPAKKGDAALTFATKATHPVAWAAFLEYSNTDTVALSEVFNAMPMLPDDVLDVFHMCMEMNFNGYPFDMELAERIVAKAKEYELGASEIALRKYGIENLKSAKQVQKALRERGIFLDTLNAKLRGDVSHEILDLRDNATGSSFSKISAARMRINPDGRIRGELRAGGTHTGRLAGKGVQPQNFARILSPVDPTLTNVTSYEHLKQHMRLCIKAPDEHKLLVGDLSQIEARVLSWLSGSQWLLDAFERGDDIYARNAERMFGLTNVTKDSVERQFGKIAVLSLGYGCGAKRFLTSNLAFFSRLGDGAEAAASDTVAKYRDANRPIVQLWRAVEDAFRYAMQYGVARLQTAFTTLVFEFEDQRTMRIALPSGRALYYRGVYSMQQAGKQSQLVYTNYATGAQPVFFWGGKLVENIVQAIAADVLLLVYKSFQTYGLLDAYNITSDSLSVCKPILQVHDELVYLIPDEYAERALTTLKRVLHYDVPWAEGLPLSGEAFLDDRYTK